MPTSLETDPERLDAPVQRMLLVEDDLELSTVLVRIARRTCPDLEIDWVGEWKAAREHLDANHYDAVLADLYLADGKRGHTLAYVHRDREPDGCFALMSSCPLEELARVLPHADIPILSKPFTTKEYGEFVASLLDRTREKQESRKCTTRS